MLLHPLIKRYKCPPSGASYYKAIVIGATNYSLDLWTQTNSVSFFYTLIDPVID